MVRQEHGTDIDAACGQLRSNTMKRDRQKAVAVVNPTMKKTYESYFWSGGVIFIVFVSFTFALPPQEHSSRGGGNPGIQHLGRLVFLLTLSILWKLGEVSDIGQLCWLFLQNILNVFLLFPLIFQLPLSPSKFA